MGAFSQTNNYTLIEMSPFAYIHIVHESENTKNCSSVSDVLFVRLTCN